MVSRERCAEYSGRESLEHGAKADFEALDISIRDHLVIGRKGQASFRSLGLL